MQITTVGLPHAEQVASNDGGDTRPWCLNRHSLGTQRGLLGRSGAAWRRRSSTLRPRVRHVARAIRVFTLLLRPTARMSVLCIAPCCAEPSRESSRGHALFADAGRRRQVAKFRANAMHVHIGAAADVSRGSAQNLGDGFERNRLSGTRCEKCQQLKLMSG